MSQNNAHSEVLLDDSQMEELLSKLKRYVDEKIAAMGQSASSGIQSPDTNSLPTHVTDMIVKHVSKISAVKKILYSKTASEIQLVVVYLDSDDPSIFDRIVDQILELEKRLPNYHISSWILQESETDRIEITKDTSIFTRG